MRNHLLTLVAAALVLLPAPVQAVVNPLPVGPDVDYQLGGVSDVPANVGIVVRDRRAAPAPGRYNVCYVNGFQTQPDERAFWRAHRSLVLRRGGRPVVDSAWAAFAMHHLSWPTVGAKLRPDGFMLRNDSVFLGEAGHPGVTLGRGGPLSTVRPPGQPVSVHRSRRTSSRSSAWRRIIRR